MSTSTIQLDEWLSERDLAHILGKSPATMSSERCRGTYHPPYYRFGQKVRYRRSEVEAWMATCRRVPAATQLAETA